MATKKGFQKGHKSYITDDSRKKMSETAIKNKRVPPRNFGSDNFNWKGGNSRGYKTGYYSTEYKIWRKSVFERDGYKCQVCNIVGGYITAHHIKSFAHYPELRFDINNGVTLCEECHKLTDNYKGKAKNKLYE